MFQIDRKKILTLSIFIASWVISFCMGIFNLYIPDEAEYISGAKNFTERNNLIEPSLNKEFDTVFFFSLNGTGIIDQYSTYSARFPGSIIYYSTLNFIMGEREIKKTYQFNLFLLSMTLCFATGLMIGKKNTVFAYLGGAALYIIYSEVIFDVIVPAVLLLTGLYHILWKNNKVGHACLIMCCWYRYEFLVFYGIFGFYLFLKKILREKKGDNGKKLIFTILGIILSIFLIYGLQTFYKKELGISRDNLDYVINDYYGVEQDSLSIDDNNKSAINTAIRYSGLKIDQIKYRLWHLYYLLVRTSFISILIPIGWIILLFHRKNKEYKILREALLVMTLFNLTIYGRDIRYYGYNIDILHSSYIRYSLPIIIVVGALGAKYIAKKYKVIAIFLIFSSLLPVIGYLSYQYNISNNGGKYKFAAEDFAKKIGAEENRKIVWVGTNEFRKIIYLEYPNQFSLNAVPDKFMLPELNKLQLNSMNLGYKTIFSTNKNKIPEKIAPYLEGFFYPPQTNGNFSFYLMRNLKDQDSRELHDALMLKMKKSDDEY